MQTDEAWKAWGKNDPYYGVLSDNRFRGKILDKTLQAEFFRSGDAHWRLVRETCDKLYGKRGRDCAVDFGCGVGRVLLPMSRDYIRTIGIDISSDMLAASAQNSPNSELIASDDELSKLEMQTDMVHSVIVLQHIAPDRGLKIIRRLLNSLSSGGVAAIHFTLKRPQRFSKRLVYFLKHNIPGARWLFNIFQGKSLSEPLMQMNEYDLSAVLKEYEAAGIEEIYLMPSIIGETLAVMAFGSKRAV